jgi:hypothetical protein
METPGDAWPLIFSDPELRQGMIHDAQRSHRSSQASNRINVLRCWVAQVLHGLAARVDQARPRGDAQELWHWSAPKSGIGE